MYSAQKQTLEECKAENRTAVVDLRNGDIFDMIAFAQAFNQVFGGENEQLETNQHPDDAKQDTENA